MGLWSCHLPVAWVLQTVAPVFSLFPGWAGDPTCILYREIDGKFLNRGDFLVLPARERKRAVGGFIECLELSCTVVGN